MDTDTICNELISTFGVQFADVGYDNGLADWHREAISALLMRDPDKCELDAIAQEMIRRGREILSEAFDELPF